jgi:hypothetical protein
MQRGAVRSRTTASVIKRLRKAAIVRRRILQEAKSESGILKKARDASRIGCSLLAGYQAINQVAQGLACFLIGAVDGFLSLWRGAEQRHILQA